MVSRVLGQAGASRGRDRGRRAGAGRGRSPRSPRVRGAAAAAVAARPAVAAAVAAAHRRVAGADRLQLLVGLAGDVRVVGEAQADAAALLSTSTTRTEISSPLLRISSTVAGRWPGAMLEMCSRPSVPLASSTKAPNVVVLTTLARREVVADLDLLGHRPDAVDERVALDAGLRVDEHLCRRRRRRSAPRTPPEAADRLAALADQQADLVRIDLDRRDARRVAPTARRAACRSTSAILPRMNMPARPCACASASRMISNVTPVILMSIWRAVMPCSRAGDLEVHVAEVVLHAGDVGQDDVVVALLDQAHGDARHRAP